MDMVFTNCQPELKACAARKQSSNCWPTNGMVNNEDWFIFNLALHGSILNGKITVLTLPVGSCEEINLTFALHVGCIKSNIVI